MADTMPSPIRIDIPNVVYEETFRCQQRRFLMLPEEELNDLILGAIGRGLHLFPNVRLHDLNFAPNHGHRLISSTDGCSRSKFGQFVNQRISFEAGRRYGWDDGIFRRSARPIPCVTHHDQLKRYRYLRSHGVKEDLVAKCDDWPCVTALPFLRYGKELEGTFVWRDDETRARRRKTFNPDLYRERYPVRLTKLPALAHLSWDEIHQYTDELSKDIEATYAAKRIGSPSGRAALLARDPFDSPKSSSHSPAPIVHCEDRSLRERFRRLVRYLTDALRDANRKLKEGASTVIFPPFCHPANLPYVSWESAMVQVDAGEVKAPTRLGAQANAPPSLLDLLEDAQFLAA